MDNAQVVIDALDSNLSIKEVSLDHDLGNEEAYGNGYQVLAWIEEKVYRDETYVPPHVQIHTANPVALQKMSACLTSIRRQLLKRR